MFFLSNGEADDDVQSTPSVAVVIAVHNEVHHLPDKIES